jgi:hypothetical protein
MIKAEIENRCICRAVDKQCQTNSNGHADEDLMSVVLLRHIMSVIECPKVGVAISYMRCILSTCNQRCQYQGSDSNNYDPEIRGIVSESLQFPI